jgi:hypothetical protein
VGAVALALALILPVAWYLGSPLFLDRSVEEEFPLSSRAELPVGMERAQAEEEMRRAAGTQRQTGEPAPEEGPTATRLATGQFEDADDFHMGSGGATVYQLPQGRVLRLENLEVTNGPNLFVYLSGHPAPRSSAQLHEQGDFEVAPLKGNKGSQNYELPADLDMERYRSVVIYCKRFRVVFSTARLASGT